MDIGPAAPMQDDQFAAVLENRRRLAQFLPSAPVWLAQVHATQVVQVDRDNVADLLASPPTADAAVTRAHGIVLGVRTADCLPVLFADRGGTVIGAAHAGWRGLAGGVLECTLRAMDAPARDIVAWLGPAIGPRMFEVGADVFDAFCATDPGAASCFAPHCDGKWLADLVWAGQTPPPPRRRHGDHGRRTLHDDGTRAFLFVAQGQGSGSHGHVGLAGRWGIMPLPRRIGPTLISPAPDSFLLIR